MAFKGRRIFIQLNNEVVFVKMVWIGSRLVVADRVSGEREICKHYFKVISSISPQFNILRLC